MGVRVAMSGVSHPEGAVSLDVVAQVADGAAAQVWAGPIARGDAVPLSDGSAVTAYVFPYALGSDRCPGTEELLAEIIQLRSRSAPAPGQPDRGGPVARFARQYGSVCVSATTVDPPVQWVAHLLPDFHLLAGSAAAVARGALDGEVWIVEYIRTSPERQYLRFAGERSSILVDAIEPGREVPAEAASRASLEPPPEGRIEAAREEWARVLGVSRSDADRAGAAAAGPAALSALPPVPGLLPVGVSASGPAPAPAPVVMTNWELIPWVNHTTHNWCVPSSWAMVLGYYDNYVPGKGALLGYGRWIDHWYELTPGGHNLPNLVDEVLPAVQRCQRPAAL